MTEIETKRKELLTLEDWEDAISKAIDKYDKKCMLTDVLFWTRAIREIGKFAKQEGKEEARKEFLDIVNKKYENTLSSLDSQFCKDEEDVKRKNFALVLYDDLLEELKQSLSEGEKTA